MLCEIVYIHMSEINITASMFREAFKNTALGTAGDLFRVMTNIQSG